MTEVSGDGFTIKEKTLQRDRLSDERFGNLLSAIGNNEAKAATLLVMRPHHIYDRIGISHELLAAQGEKKGWALDSGTTFAYLRDTLSSVGLVAKEIVDQDLNTFGYVRTEYGDGIGFATAGLLLDFSRRHKDFSLINIFGRASSASESKEVQDEEDTFNFRKRPPILRKNIFWELTTSDLPTTVTNLANVLGEDQVKVGRHLNELARRGVIQFDHGKEHQPLVAYQVSSTHPDQPPPVYGTNIKLTTAVWKILNEQPEKHWKIEDVVDQYKKNYLVHKPEGTHLQKGIMSILAHFAELQYVKRSKFPKLVYSEINLTPQQRTMLVDLVTILDGIQNQDPTIMLKGKEYASYFLSHPDELAEVLAKTKEHSSSANQQPVKETIGNILSVLSKNPGSVLDVQEQLESIYGRAVTKSRLAQLLRKLAQSNQISFTTERGINKYHLNNPQS